MATEPLCGAWDPMGHDRCILKPHEGPSHVGMMEKWEGSLILIAKSHQQKPGLGLCFYCGEQMLQNVAHNHPDRVTKDHVIPLALGGQGRHNKVLCCNWCNNSKGSLLLGEWMIMLGVIDLHRRGEIAVRKGALVLARYHEGLLSQHLNFE